MHSSGWASPAFWPLSLFIVFPLADGKYVGLDPSGDDDGNDDEIVIPGRWHYLEVA